MLIDLTQKIESCISADYTSFTFEDSDIILLDRSDDGEDFEIYKNELDDLMLCFANLDEYGDTNEPYANLYEELCTTWRLRGLPRKVGICGAMVIRGSTQIDLTW